MSRDLKQKIVLVKRATRLDDLLYKFNTIEQVQFYLEHAGAEYSDYLEEHKQYYKNLEIARLFLSDLAQLQVIDRKYLPNFIFGPENIVVAVGQDGLVANTLKYLSGQQLIGVNPDPLRWDGVLLPFSVNDLPKVMNDVLHRKRKIKEVTLAQVTLNNKQYLLAVNDFFVGHKSHVSARYSVTIGNKTEKQSSSGIVISTGLGSTAWLKSLLTGAVSISSKILHKDIKFTSDMYEIPWDSDNLYYTVREPFASKTTGVALVFGKITKSVHLKVVSQMGEHGVIFSDGIENDYLEFNAGTQAIFSLANHKGLLVV